MALPPEARAPAKKGNKKRPRAKSRPAPAVQPGPFRASERKTVRKVRRTPVYQQALRDARKEGPATRRGTKRPGGDDKSQADRDRGRPAHERGEALVRRQALAERGRGSIVRAVERELEGRGELAEEFGKLADLIYTSGTAPASDVGGSLTRGSIALQGKASRGRLPGATVEPPPAPRLKGTLAGRAIKDVVNFPAQALPSLYVPAAGVVEAAQGRPERLQQLGRDIDEHDPIYNLGAAAVEAVGGDTKAAKTRLKRARKAASEHPGFAGLEAVGALRGATTGAGAVGRTGVAGKRVKRAVSTERAPRTLPGTDLIELRQYSSDPLVKGAQVAGEKIGGNSSRIPDREIRRRVDETVAVADEMARNRHGNTDLEPLAELGVDRVLDEFGVRRVEDLPKVAQDRLNAHEQSRTGGPKTLRVANRAFRETVLSTSPAWFAGNIIEGLGRAAVARAGPRSYITGRRVLRRIDPAVAEEAMARMVSGGHMASVTRERVPLGPGFWSGTNLAPLANGLHKFWKAPGPKQAAQVWHQWTEFAFRTVSGTIETHIQSAMLGKALRKSELMDGQLVKLSKEAAEQAAEGLRATEQQVRFGRAVDRMYGRYSKLGPGERQFIALYTPFIRWYLNSIEFVGKTLPVDHPVLTGLIASAEQATEEWRKDHKLDKFVEDALPGFLQGSIPTDGGSQRISRFTPFGAFGSPTETAAGQVLPLWKSVEAALEGKTWNGRDLEVDDGSGGKRPANEIERAVAAAYALAQATIPGVSIEKRLREGGPRAFDPFKDVKPKKKKLRIAQPAAKKKLRKAKPAGAPTGLDFFK
jgi:hypothetical protein